MQNGSVLTFKCQNILQNVFQGARKYISSLEKKDKYYINIYILQCILFLFKNINVFKYI